MLTALVRFNSLWIYVLFFHNYSMFCYPSSLIVDFGFGKNFFLILIVVFLGWSSKSYFDSLVVLKVAIGFLVVSMVCCYDSFFESRFLAYADFEVLTVVSDRYSYGFVNPISPHRCLHPIYRLCL